MIGRSFIYSCKHRYVRPELKTLPSGKKKARVRCIDCSALVPSVKVVYDQT